MDLTVSFGLRLAGLAHASAVGRQRRFNLSRAIDTRGAVADDAPMQSTCG
jgi:hypothetical protein